MNDLTKNKALMENLLNKEVSPNRAAYDAITKIVRASAIASFDLENPLKDKIENNIFSQIRKRLGPTSLETKQVALDMLNDHKSEDGTVERSDLIRLIKVLKSGKVLPKGDTNVR